MDERHQLLLAVGIVEWGQALTQLHLLGEHGDDWHRVVDELHTLIQQWPGVQAVTPEEAGRVIAEATTYITRRYEEETDATLSLWLP